MGLFATSKAVKSLQRDMEEMEAVVRKLRAQFRDLDLEFTQLYDKVSHQMSRMSKRNATRTARQEENGEDQLEFVDGTDPISAKILARRAHAGGKQ